MQKETDMAVKRGSKTTRRVKKAKDLRVSGAMAKKTKGGGKGKPAFEIKDFSFGVENPTTIGSATGGAGQGSASASLSEIKVK